jgi:HEAT repeat protein
MLTGGNPNSLGNTLQVVKTVLADKRRLNELYQCYFSEDEVVRLRVSNAMKRIFKEQPEWIAEHLDGLTTDIASIDQASTRWTLATLFMWLDAYMTQSQRQKAIAVMKHNLTHDNDWIVLNTTAESLAFFARKDKKLASWLLPELKKLTQDKHKSVSNRARKLIVSLDR